MLTAWLIPEGGDIDKEERKIKPLLFEGSAGNKQEAPKSVWFCFFGKIG